jgi:hypothetical protein
MKKQVIYKEPANYFPKELRDLLFSDDDEEDAEEEAEEEKAVKIENED